MDAQPASPLSRSVLVLAALCLAVAVGGVVWSAWDMFGAARRPMLQGWDDSFYYYWLPSAVIDGDVDFTNQVEASGTLPPAAQAEALAQPRTPTGLLPNKYPPGWALGSLPFFLVAHAFTPQNATGFEPPYLLAVWLGQLLYAGLGVGLAIRIVARFFPAQPAALAVLAVWLASPLVYYQGARLSMSHSQVFALAMVAFWAALRLWDGEQRPRTWAVLGASAALLVITRNVAVLYLIWPAFVLLRRLRSWRAAGWLLVGGAVPVLVQLVAWKALYGSWLVYSYAGERFDFGQLRFAEVLFSSRHGWFYWHPLLGVAIASFLVWSWRRVEGRAWLISLAGTVVLNAAWPTWWLGSSFGHRGFEVPTLFAALGLAAILSRATRPWQRCAAAAAVTVAVAWNLALLGLFLTQRIPREEPVRYLDAARALGQWVAPASLAGER